MRIRAFASAAALLLAMGAAQAAPTQLVVNGGFESTSLANGSWGNFGSVNGWQVVGGPGTGIEVRRNNAGTAHSGNNFVELDTNGNTTIEQLFNGLIAGSTYDLSFWYSPRIGQSASTNGLRAYWNGEALGGVITRNGGSVNEWLQYQFDVTAVAGVNSLRFASVGTSDSLGGNLDDVSLTAKLPEPSTGALLAGALGALAWSRRRKG